MPDEVTVRLHSTVAACPFCRAEAIGSEQQLEREIANVQASNEADCCSFHGQVIAALAQAHGRTVRWVTDEAGEDAREDRT